MKMTSLPAFLALFLLGAPGLAQAQGLGLNAQNNGKPMSIEADDGIEWQQDSHLYVARGKVKATRGDVTIYADTLTAYYRPTSSSAPKPAAGGVAGFGGGNTEIYRVDADGHVRITTPTQTAVGDHAVYDSDQQLVMLTGKDLRLVTPRDTITAHDSIEWYEVKQLAVARGNAIAIRDDKRLRGDVLTAQVAKGANNQASRISRVDAHGNVLASSKDQIARGDKGVYNVDTGIATLSGRVTLTKQENELRGQYAVVDMNNNTSRLLSAPPGGAPSGRVEGLIMPREKGK